jgi:hypothetical protein
MQAITVIDMLERAQENKKIDALSIELLKPGFPAYYSHMTRGKFKTIIVIDDISALI